MRKLIRCISQDCVPSYKEFKGVEFPEELIKEINHFYEYIEKYDFTMNDGENLRLAPDQYPDGSWIRDLELETHGFYLTSEVLKYVRNSIAHGKDISLIPTEKRLMYTVKDLINNTYFTYPDPIEFLFFWGANQKDPNVIDKSCLSNHFKGKPFVISFEGKFDTTEQYMMRAKAKAMGDYAMERAILNEPDPVLNKAQGRKIKGFDEKKWEKIKVDVVFKGNYEKFTTHPELKEFLLSTGNKVLVEASPYDRIWGIGLRASDVEANDPSKWRGTNLLGFCLMDVRQRIRNEEREKNEQS